MKFLRAAIAVLAALLAGPVLAQSASSGWPNKPITLVVPFPPGGGTDVMGRVIAEKLRRRGNLKNIVIENRAGASGTLPLTAAQLRGVRRVARELLGVER